MTTISPSHNNDDSENNNHWLNPTCEGEQCSICGKPAAAKVEESITSDDPFGNRHPLTAYVCREHFWQIMGDWGVDFVEKARNMTTGP